MSEAECRVEGSLGSGLRWVLVSSLGFSVASLLVKALGPGVPVWWVVFVRCAASLPLLALLLRREGVAFASPRWPALLLRGAWGVLSVACYFWALPRMPLADAVLLLHASPLYAALWGALFLGETVPAAAMLWIAACFAGVCLIVGPQFSFSGTPYVAALAGGVFNSLSLTSVKSLTRSEPPLRIVFYSAAIGSLAFAPWAWASGYQPAAGEWARMSLVGFALMGAQLALAAGLSRAPVSRAASGTFFAFVLNVFLGWLLWGEAPGARSWLGCALVAGGIVGLSRGLSVPGRKTAGPAVVSAGGGAA